MTQSLQDRMRALADKGGPEAAELRQKADALDVAIARVISELGTKEDTKHMLGCWARARRLWCDITGESLV